jgi:hypothetical protein
MGYTKWAMATFFTPTWPTVENSFGASPASRTEQEAYRRSPLAPRLVQWLQMAAENQVRWLPRVQHIPQLVGKNPSTIGRYM